MAAPDAPWHGPGAGLRNGRGTFPNQCVALASLEPDPQVLHGVGLVGMEHSAQPSDVTVWNVRRPITAQLEAAKL